MEGIQIQKKEVGTDTKGGLYTLKLLRRRSVLIHKKMPYIKYPSPRGRCEASEGDDIEVASARAGRVRRRGASGEARRRDIGDVRGGAPHPWRAARDWARGGAHKQSLSKSTTPLSPGRRGGATARSALGWYRPSVGVPRDVGCCALVVFVAYIFSVQFRT